MDARIAAVLDTHYSLSVSRMLFCLYLLLAATAEAALAWTWLLFGLAVHTVLLLLLLLHSWYARSTASRHLALGLMIVPLLRFVSLALPLSTLPRTLWPLLIAGPVLLSIRLIIRETGVTREQLSLRRGNIILQLLLAMGGFGLGGFAYKLLQPTPIMETFAWSSLVLSSVVLIVCTGFIEAFILHGLLQGLAMPALGRWTLLYVTLMATALSLGAQSIAYSGFVMVISLLSSYIVFWSGTIVGTSLLRGITNMMTFLLMPYLEQQVQVRGATLLSWGLWLAAIVWGSSIVLLMWQAEQAGRLAFTGVSDDVTNLRQAGARRSIRRKRLLRHSPLRKIR